VLDRHIAELEAREGAAAARPYVERAKRIAQEPSPARRQLLADSLSIELAARAAARRESERSLTELTCRLAELEQMSGGATEKALIERTQAALQARDGRAAKDLVSDVTAAVERIRNEAASASRRKAVLEALSGLGYEVREGMETAWATDGNLTLRSARRAGYGVQVIGGAESKPLQLRAVGFGAHGAARDSARDLEAETLWCSDFDALMDQIASAEASFSVEHAVPAGQTPLKIVEETAHEGQRDGERRAPLRQAKR
jgi:hypothetical protein